MDRQGRLRARIVELKRELSYPNLLPAERIALLDSLHRHQKSLRARLIGEGESEGSHKLGDLITECIVESNNKGVMKNACIEAQQR